MSTLFEQLCQMGLGYHLLLAALGLFFFVQLYYYIHYFAAPIRHQKKIDGQKRASKLPNVSVIVSAENEAENLAEFLPKLLSQKYPSKFEVVVVNNGSTDESNEVLDRMVQEHSNLKISFLPKAAKYMSRKKMCLSIGIKAAAYDVLVFTDADCEPSSDKWLENIAMHHDTEDTVVLGAARFKKLEGMTGKLIDYDNLFFTMRTIGYAVCGKPFCGTIRNMSYNKSVYYAAKGFSQHLNLQSGEDDVFLQDANVKSEDVSVEINASSIVTCNRTLTAKSYRLAKDQRLESEKLYRGSTKMSFFVEKASRLLFYAAAFAAMVLMALECQWLGLGIVVFCFLTRYIVQAVVISKNAKWLGTQTHPFGQIFFDIYLPFYELYLRTIGRIGRKRWEMWRE